MGKRLPAEERNELYPEEEALFQKALATFKETFKCDLSKTGYSNMPSEDGGIYAVEFWVDLDIKFFNGMDLKIGGWFSMDLRDYSADDFDEEYDDIEVEEDEEKLNLENISIYCLLGMTINSNSIGDCEGFNGYYDIDNDTWDLSWGSY